MILDANLLIYAVARRSAFHQPAREWLEGALEGAERVGIPWTSLGAFARIITDARAADPPLSPPQACECVRRWLASPVAWTPEPGPGYLKILTGLIERYELRGNLIPDAQLAALAIEHGLTVYSADTDFARFSELNWVNPVAPN